MFAVQYRLVAAYPARPLLDDVSARLASRGWKPMERDFLNADVPTSNVRGWTSFLDGRSKPPAGVHQWQGGWTDAKGDVVVYALTYKSPADGIAVRPPDGQTQLEVNAFLMPAGKVRAMQAAADRARKK